MKRAISETAINVASLARDFNTDRGNAKLQSKLSAMVAGLSSEDFIGALHAACRNGNSNSPENFPIVKILNEMHKGRG